MALLDDILTFNKGFVESKEYETLRSNKYPEKKLVIISCMDTRLVELLPKAMNFRNGDVKIIKVAGAIVSHPFGSIMRSILVAVYELGAAEVCVVGHHDCGMSSIQAQNTIQKMKERGISEDKIETLRYSGIDLNRFLRGFSCVQDSVKHSVETIQNHPLLTSDVPVHGMVIDPKTGELEVIINGYNHQ